MLMASPVFFPFPETRQVDWEGPLPRVGRFATRVTGKPYLIR